MRPGDNTWAAVFQYKIIVRKRLPVNRCAYRAVSRGKVPPLAHEIRNDAMEARRLESVRRGSIDAQLSKVFRRFWTHVLAEFDRHSAERRLVRGDVQEDFPVVVWCLFCVVLLSM